jgi:NAD(P)-dependent dehydrogenase (short-subunit alcohol dehydrogenase family)
MKTVPITGCSSGYGLETARHFHEQGWNVVARHHAPILRSQPRKPFCGGRALGLPGALDPRSSRRTKCGSPISPANGR